MNQICAVCGGTVSKYADHVCKSATETISDTLDPAYRYGSVDQKTKSTCPICGLSNGQHHPVCQVTVPKATEPTGLKNDPGKPMWSRLPFDAVNEIVKVLDYGVREYSEDNWKHVTNSRARYLSATFRHLAKYAVGEQCDRDSGLPHLAHAGTNILFLIWEELECSKVKSKKP